MKADLILTSRNIFTAPLKEPFSGGVAIKGNRILAVGPDALNYQGENTQIRDYGDKLIMPGFVDAHVHYFMGAISASEHMCSTCLLYTSKQNFEQLLQGGTLQEEINEQVAYGDLSGTKGAVWSLLLSTGYLKVVKHEFSEKTGRYSCTLALTNREVQLMFESMIRNWFAETEDSYRCV